MVLFHVFLACQSSVEPLEEAILPTLEPEIESKRVWIEPLKESQIMGVFAPYKQVYHSEGQIWVYDESTDEEISLMQGEYCNALLVGDQQLLAIDGVLYRLEGDTLIEADINAALNFSTTNLFSYMDSIFIWGAGEVYRWSDNNLSRISLSVPHIYEIGIVGDLLYLSTPDLISYNMQSQEVLVHTQYPVSSLRVDTSHTLWFLHEGDLEGIRLDGAHVHYDLGEELLALASHPVGSTIWIRGTQGAFSFEKGEFSSIDIPSSAIWSGVDDHGRLLYVDGGSSYRASIGRPVILPRLLPMTEISVLQSYKMLPSHPSDITEIAAFIDGQALPFSQVLWSVTVDPEQFPEGVQDMRILLHTEEESFLEILSFVNKELPAVSWEDDVAPLNQAKCIECHGGSTQTVLVEKENWKNKINEIIDEVSLGVMPLGGSPLSEEEITTIRAWKQGGFQ